MVLHVRLTPKGGRDAFDGLSTGADGKVILGARVRAVPENGLANEALLTLIAKTMRIKKSSLELVSGATARQKTIRITGNPVDILPLLAELCGT